MRSIPVLLAATAASALLLSSVQAAPIYSVSILDLGSLPGGSDSNTDGNSTLNNFGQVVGFATTNNQNHAFRTAPNSALTASSDLGTFTGDSSFAQSLNDSGQVVGRYFTGGLGSSFHAYRTTATGGIDAASDLGTAGGRNSVAYGINAAGYVAAASETTVGSSVNHAFRVDPGATFATATDLGSLGGNNSFSYAINTAGRVVGAAQNANGAYRAFRTDPFGNITPSSDLGTLAGGTTATAFAINASGQTVGEAGLKVSFFEVNHAFRTIDNPNGSTTLQDLGTLGGDFSRANAINTAGQVVGYSTLNGAVDRRAFFFDTTGPMINLNSLLPANSGWVLTEADGINDVGQISGYGTFNGQTHAFLLALPEPGSASLLVIAAAGLLARQRRRF